MLVADLISPTATRGSRRASRDRRARRADPRDHARGRRHRPLLFGGAFVVDHYALALKGFFLVVTYIMLLLSVDYIGDGDYYQGEFYFLLLTSLFGMMAMASARDLITIFVALETITIPDVHPRRVAQARREIERGGRQVLPDRRALHRR